MADISQITLPSGTTYNIKDTNARNRISSLENSITGAMHFVGYTTTQLTEYSMVNPIQIRTTESGATTSYTASPGDVVIYGGKEITSGGDITSPTNEFVLTESGYWIKLGDNSGSFGALAFKNQTKADYTPEGTISQPTFQGISSSGEGYLETSDRVYTYFIGESDTEPQSGYDQTIGKYVDFEVGPAQSFGGTINTPTITVTPNTTTVNSITAVGSLPSWTATVSNENLTLGWSAGSLPTKGSNTTVVTSIKSASSSGLTLNAYGYKPVTAREKSTKTIDVSIMPEGVVSTPTFTGTSAEIISYGYPT